MEQEQKKILESYYKNIDELDIKELETFFFKIQNEISKRKHAEKQKLVDDFKKAYYALKDANIDIYAHESYVSSFDDFEFC